MTDTQSAPEADHSHLQEIVTKIEKEIEALGYKIEHAIIQFVHPEKGAIRVVKAPAPPTPPADIEEVAQTEAASAQMAESAAPATEAPAPASA